MSEIVWINQYPVTESFDYDKRIRLLRARKIAQTTEKAKIGGANEDDYGLIVQDDFQFKLQPSHANGSIYGYQAWVDNYCRLLREHPLYCDSLDAFVGKGFLFLERLRPPACKWNPDYPYDDLKVLFDRYNIISGIDNCHHFTPDLQIGFDLGWGGILTRLKEQRARHDAAHHAFYDSEITVVEAIIAFLQRMSAEILSLADQEQNPALKANLVKMATVNQRMATETPATFREAVQWLCWFSMLSRTYNRGSAGGQLDELLRPYYERDVAAGRLTDEETVFYLACLFLQDSRYFQLGGPDRDGNDLVSRLSYLALEAADKINIACNLTVRVHEQLDPVFFRKSVSYLFHNKQGWPRFSSDTALAEGFMRSGFSLEQARKRVAAGCHWMCMPGLEYTMNDTVKINLAKVFMVAFDEAAAEQASIEHVWTRFCHHLGEAVRATGAGIMHHLRYQTKSQPELILNLFQHGLIEKGVNITDGGANFYNMCLDGSGIAVAADSFAACETRIDREGRLTYPALKALLDSDFAGTEGEYLRRMLQRSPRFGGGDTLADQWARRINQTYTDLVRALCQDYPGINFIPGYFSWSNTIVFGKTVGATPDGRRQGEPINHGANPNNGFRKDGAVTAMCNSIAAIQPNYGNTAPVQLELDPGIADDADGIDKMCAMIRAILKSGNTLLNINLIDAQKLIEANQNPDKYPDLVVRVTGFTAFFAMLTPEFRQLVLDRVLAVNPESQSAGQTCPE
jgi:formate C-acetyltransferase